MSQESDPRQTLIELVRQRGRELLRSPNQLQGLLADLCSDSRRKVNALVTSMKCGHLRLYLDNPNHNGNFSVSHVAHVIEQDFGFNDELSYWVAESWGLALDRISEDQVAKSTACPHCNLPVQAPTEWRKSRLICPRCKAEVYFSIDLKPTTKIKGTPNNISADMGNWILVDPKLKVRSLNEQLLNEAISQVLEDDTLADSAKCDRLQLRRILARLDRELDPILTEIRGKSLRGSPSSEGILAAVLRGFEPQITLKFDNDVLLPDVKRLLLASEVPSDEMILAATDFTAFGSEVSGVAFGSDSLFYFNGRQSTRPGAGRVYYKQLQAHPAVSRGLHEIGFQGLAAVLNLAGSGISKGSFLTVLRVLGLIAATLDEN